MKTLCFAVLATTLAFANTAAAADEAAEKAAVTAAETWLKLVDASDYAKSWDEAAQLFKGAVTKADWDKTIKGVRGPLGKLVTRKVSTKKYAEKLPGAPDGKYVVITFETSFENKKEAVETVTPMLDKDGKWRVSGYFIK
ncbi:MAG: DUF4019 domain-containing protein [Deltaproteobacteria bacterium]|nr:DUF4019 domain-containing protein [Deltaproteobacteria bacterium]